MNLEREYPSANPRVIRHDCLSFVGVRVEDSDARDLHVPHRADDRHDSCGSRGSSAKRWTDALGGAQTFDSILTAETLCSSPGLTLPRVMRHVILRVWVADRPGSLGQLATRIGEFGCDLIGIDVLERDGARAADELTVELPEGFTPDSLVAAVSSVPGIEVEDLRFVVSRAPDTAGRDPMETAVLLTEVASPPELMEALTRGVSTVFACEWAAVLDLGTSPARAIAVAGAPPNANWLDAFRSGLKASWSTSEHNSAIIGPRDVAWGALEFSDLLVVIGRDGPPFRGRERRQLQQLCRIADSRWIDVVRRAEEPQTVRGSSGNQRLAAS